MAERVVFLSDIHSNLEALNSVLEDIGSAKIYCLGDLVGYGANPNEVVEWAKSEEIECVMGNHDYAVVTGDVSWFNYQAQAAALWTRRMVSKENMSFLKALPYTRILVLDTQKFLLVHGSPDDPVYEYVFPQTHENLFDRYLKRSGADVAALGHTHVPFIWRSEAGVVFNPGSVGQPRSGIPKASYAVVKMREEGVEVEHHLVSYDIDSAAEKILKNGLPKFLANRLYQGI